MALSTVLGPHLLISGELRIVLLHDRKVNHFLRVLSRGERGSLLSHWLFILRGRGLPPRSPIPRGARLRDIRRRPLLIVLVLDMEKAVGLDVAGLHLACSGFLVA